MSLFPTVHHVSIATALLSASVSAAQNLPAGAEERPIATAQPASTDPMPLTEKIDEPSLSLSLTAGFIASAKTKGGGEVQRSSIGIDAGYSWSVSDKLTLGINAGASRQIYDFKNPTLLAGGLKPWKNVNTVEFGLSAAYTLDERWTLISGGSVVASGTSDADFNKSLTYGGAVGASYAFSDSLSLGVLLAVQTRLEDNTIVLPLPILEWTLPLDEEGRWKLGLGSTGSSGVASGGLALTYKASDELDLALSLGGIGFGGEFRLDKTGPVPNGVGRDNSTTLTIGADWRPTPAVQIGAYAGVALSGSLEVLNQNGVRIRKQDVESAPTFGLRATIGF